MVLCMVSNKTIGGGDYGKLAIKYFGFQKFWNRMNEENINT